MPRDVPHPIPAAVPTLVFAAALAFGASLSSPLASAAGLAAAGLLSLFAPRSRCAPLALTFLLAAAGVALSARQRGHTSALEWITGHSAGRFVTVICDGDGSWISRGEREWQLRAGRFHIEGAGRRLDAALPLRIVLRAEAPPAPAATLRLEGLLRETPAGFSLSVKSTRLVSSHGAARRWSPASWNRALAASLDRLAATDETLAAPAALAGALALGRSDRLPEDVRDSYRRGGTYHFLVFSGMQIALAAGFLAWLLRRARSPRVADVALLAVAILSPAFAGNEASVTRASWMIGLFAFSRLLARPTPPENLLFVSALLRLALVPSDVGQPGFALTYAATGGLILVGRSLASLAGRHGKVATAIAYGLGAELAIAPLSLAFFHQFVLLGFAVTLLLSPVLTAMFALSAGACATAAGAPLLADAMLRSIATLDRACAAVNGAVADSASLLVHSAAPTTPLLVCVYAAVALLLATRRWPALAPVLLLVPLAQAAWLTHARAVTPTAQVEALDVGQGDAILLRDGATAVLFDGGGRAGDPRFGRTVLLPLLLERGVTRLDAVAFSHPHPDHCEGLFAVLQNLHVGELWLSAAHLRSDYGLRLAEVAASRGIPVRLLRTGDRVRAGALRFDVLFANHRFKRSPVNNGSVVLRTRLGGRSLLLTGDAEREAERELVEAAAPMLRADILKVGHHGSGNSTTPPFLDAVRPRVALVSCGRDNLFGHPHPRVVAALAGEGARLYRTDVNGTVILRIDGGRIFGRREIDVGR